MREKDLYTILLLVESGAGLDSALEAGFSYSQIATLLSDAIESGFVSSKDDVLKLTEEGVIGLRRLRKKYNINGSNAIVVKRQQMWFTPQDRFEVYLPLHNCPN